MAAIDVLFVSTRVPTFVAVTELDKKSRIKVIKKA